tara:strand:+ start:772 stop:999 length:228 start_codon:yes stop_codon:yes gene_type:complete
MNEIYLYVTIGIFFNLFIDFTVWVLFKYKFLTEKDKIEHLPWDTRTKIMVTFTWPAVLLFLIWTVFINPQKTEDE